MQSPEQDWSWQTGSAGWSRESNGGFDSAVNLFGPNRVSGAAPDLGVDAIAFGGDMREPVTRSARRLLGLLSVVACAPLGDAAVAQMQMVDMADRAGITIAAEGRSGAALRDSSVRQLPWQRISPAGRNRIQEVLDNCAQYRQLPELHYEVRPDFYRYLVEHPDVAVSTWRVMGISKVQMWQTGAMEFEATAPDGSIGLADVLYRDPSQCLLLFDGTYSSPLLPRPITAAGLVWLRYDYRPGANGATQVRQKLDVFVSFPSIAARAMALLVSPITNVMMDRNAFEVSLYARMMSQAAENDPAWVEQVAGQLDGVLPRRRRELASLVRSVETDRDRTASVSGRTAGSGSPLHTLRATMIELQRGAAVPISSRAVSSRNLADADPPGVHHMTDPLPRAVASPRLARGQDAVLPPEPDSSDDPATMWPASRRQMPLTDPRQHSDL